MYAEPTTRLGRWIKHHDESWLFVAIYLGLAVGLSVFVSLFWLVVVAAFHLVLELVRQSYYQGGRSRVFLQALWEVKLDVGLVLLALTLVLYIEVVLGILGVQSAARAGAVGQVGSRAGSKAATGAAVLEQWIRGFLLAMDEMIRVAYATLMVSRRKGSADVGAGGDAAPEIGAGDDASEAGPRQPAAPAVPGLAWRSSWGMADHIGLAMVALGIILILAAPYLTPHGWDTAVTALLKELRPLPM